MSETMTYASRSTLWCSCHNPIACPISWTVAPTPHPSSSQTLVSLPTLRPTIALQRPASTGRKRTNSDSVVRWTSVMTVLVFHSSMAFRIVVKACSLKPGSITYGTMPSGQRSPWSVAEMSRRTGQEPVGSLLARLLRFPSSTSSTVPSTMSPSWTAIPLTTSYRSARPRW